MTTHYFQSKYKRRRGKVIDISLLTNTHSGTPVYIDTKKKTQIRNIDARFAICRLYSGDSRAHLYSRHLV